MTRQLSFTTYSIFIILTLSNVSILADGCGYGQHSCFPTYPEYLTWCCDDSDACGSSYRECSSDESPSVLTIVLVPTACAFCCCCLAIMKCCYAENQPTQPVRRVTRVVPARQRRRAPIVTHVNPGIYGSTITPIHNVSEELPPAYDSIIKDSQYQLPTEFAPPKYETNEEVNLRV